jgi:hypothetical protein
MAYSKKTLESWHQADAFLTAKVAELGGRALKPGEFLDFLKEAHKQTAMGMIEVGETYMKPDQLGVFRSGQESAVGTDFMPTKVSKEAYEALGKNEFLSKKETAAFAHEVPGTRFGSTPQPWPFRHCRGCVVQEHTTPANDERPGPGRSVVALKAVATAWRKPRRRLTI